MFHLYVNQSLHHYLMFFQFHQNWKITIFIEEESYDDDVYFEDDDSSTKLFSQSELNNLVKELDLPKNKAELLGSILKKRNILKHLTRKCFLYLKKISPLKL